LERLVEVLMMAHSPRRKIFDRPEKGSMVGREEARETGGTQRKDVQMSEWNVGLRDGFL
jgi:hypothetical protein